MGSGPASERAREGADQHGVEPGVGVALLGHLVGDLQQGHAPGQPLEVLPDGAEGVEHLHLVHDVELAPPLPQQEVHVGQRLEPGPEFRGGLAHPLGHGPHLAVALGQEDDDAVGLAEAVGAQHDAACRGTGSRGRRGALACAGGIEGAVALAPPGGFGHGPPGLGGLVGGPVVGLLGRPDAVLGRRPCEWRP